jgi:hypothetical protein
MLVKAKAGASRAGAKALSEEGGRRASVSPARRAVIPRSLFSVSREAAVECNSPVPKNPHASQSLMAAPCQLNQTNLVVCADVDPDCEDARDGLNRAGELLTKEQLEQVRASTL